MLANLLEKQNRAGQGLMNKESVYILKTSSEVLKFLGCC